VGVIAPSSHSVCVRLPHIAFSVCVLLSANSPTDEEFESWSMAMA
jgi:hypothetical protein